MYEIAVLDEIIDSALFLPQHYMATEANRGQSDIFVLLFCGKGIIFA